MCTHELQTFSFIKLNLVATVYRILYGHFNMLGRGISNIFSGIKLPEEIVTVIRDSSPFGDLMKTKIHIDKQNMLPTTNNDTVLFHFDTPISRITIKYSVNF